MMKNRDEKQTTRSVMKEYIPPVVEVQYIEMEEGIATGSGIRINNGAGIKADPWEDGGSAGTGESENGEWWN